MVNAKCAYPLMSLHVMRSPRPHHFGILQAESISEAGEGLQIRLCISFAGYTSNPTCCQDPIFQFLDGLVPRLRHLPLPQTPTVVPIPGNLLLLMEYLDTVSSDLDRQRHNTLLISTSSFSNFCILIKLYS